MAYSGAITRTSLGLGDLAICNDTYDVHQEDGLAPGTQSYRRVNVTSPWVQGDQQVSAVKDAVQLTLRLDVTGADMGTVQTNVQTLLAAVGQASYTVTFTLDAATYAWSCRQADYSVGFTAMHTIGYAAPVVLVIPAQPSANL